MILSTEKDHILLNAMPAGATRHRRSWKRLPVQRCQSRPIQG